MTGSNTERLRKGDHAMAKKGTTQILAAVDELANAKQSDIAEVDAQIESLKKEIDEFARPRKEQINSLQSIRRILQLRFMPAEKRGKRGAKKKSLEGTDLKRRIYYALQTSNQPSLSIQHIANLVDSKPGYVANAIRDCDWFDSLNGQISIATKK